jgi:DNA-binding CsgD family transcriptional regulator
LEERLFDGEPVISMALSQLSRGDQLIARRASSQRHRRIGRRPHQLTFTVEIARSALGGFVPGSGDLAAVLEVAERLASVDRVEQLAGNLQHAAACIGAACVIYHQTVAFIGRPRQIDIGWAEGGFTAERLEAYSALANEHPLVRHLQTVSPAQASRLVSVSEVLSERQWRNSRIYVESQHPLGCDDQFVFTVSSDARRFAAFTIGRPGRPFNERERATVSLLRPHLTAAARRTQRAHASYRALQVLPTVREIAVETPQLRREAFDAGLTQREAAVLRAIDAGATNRQAARSLGVSPRTLTTHLDAIYRKLGVGNRLEALIVAFERA